MHGFNLPSLIFFLYIAALICSNIALVTAARTRTHRPIQTRRRQFDASSPVQTVSATVSTVISLTTPLETPLALSSSWLSSFSTSLSTSQPSSSSSISNLGLTATSSPAPTSDNSSGDTSNLLPDDSTDVVPDPIDTSNLNNPFSPHAPRLDSQNTLNAKVNTYLSYSSIVGGSIVLVVIISMWIYDKKLVNRVSLRLTAIISFVDIANAVVIIKYTNYLGRDSPTCTAIAALLSFLPEVYLFLTMMIAFNLQLVFLHRRKVTKFSDRWYIPVAFLGAILINLPPLILNRFGFDEGGTNDCYYRDSQSVQTLYWEIFTFIVPVIIAMVYCTVVLVTVVFKIVFENKRLADTLQTGSASMSTKAKEKKILVLKLVSRISLYACIPVLSVTGIVVQYFWQHFHDGNTPMWVNLWSVTGSCIPGTLNCLAFLCDPAVHNALRKVKKDLITKYGDVQLLAKTTSGSVFSPPPSPMSAMTHSPSTPSFRNSNASLQAPTSLYQVQRSSMRPIHPDLSMFDMKLQQQQQKENKFMKWFVRTFLLPKRARQETPTASLPSMATSYGYYTPHSNDSLLTANETSGGERRYPRSPRQTTANTTMDDDPTKRRKGKLGGIFVGVSSTRKVDIANSPVRVSISTPDDTESWIASSYTTSGSMRPLNVSYKKQSTSAYNQHQYDCDSSAYSQYYHSDEFEMDGSSRPSSSIIDESEWDESELNAL